jgi:hypothetical protein
MSHNNDSIDSFTEGIDDSFLQERDSLSLASFDDSFLQELDSFSNASLDEEFFSDLGIDCTNTNEVTDDEDDRNAPALGRASSEWDTFLQEDQFILRQVSDVSIEPIAAPTRFDVVTGCGRGIMGLPGNITYRELVTLHKRVYAQVHRHDKAKVSWGIVIAIRDFGGRFLKYDAETETYHDVGDKLARKKTSQALREGQTKIREQMSSDMATGCRMTALDADLLRSIDVPLPVDKYVVFSARMLRGLHAN